MKLPMWLIQVLGPHIIIITVLPTADLFSHTTCRFLQIQVHAIPLLHHLPQPVHQVHHSFSTTVMLGTFRCRV